VYVKFDVSKFPESEKEGDSICIKLEKSTVEGKHDTVIARRQLPLILSWAISIQQTQGMTLVRAIVYLRDCFGHNMDYVAISRFKTLEGLAIKTLDIPRLVRGKYTSPDSLAEIVSSTNSNF
jgi:ATP-dependent exoDNAse (exonuclease V) alpha subunit